MEGPLTINMSDYGNMEKVGPVGTSLPEKKVPMMLFMCGTTCDPVDNVVESGWLQKAEEENFIVISPDYLS